MDGDAKTEKLKNRREPDSDETDAKNGEYPEVIYQRNISYGCHRIQIINHNIVISIIFNNILFISMPRLNDI